VATLRLAEQLQSTWKTHRINTMIPAEASFGAKLKHYRSAARELERVLDDHPDSLIIWSSISPETVGHWRDLLTLFPRLKGRRVIAVAHWGKFATIFDNAATRWSARRLLPGLNRIVFTAPVLSDACSAWLPEQRRAVIPNTLDAALIPDSEAIAARIKQGPSSPPRVLFLSSMIREKGWEDVLDAAAKLKSEGHQHDWTFAGGWPHSGEEQRFHDRVRELDLENDVRHVGLLKERADIARAHMEADIFVLPSWLREAQPLSILEAMAAGTPCIVANDGGMPGMIGADTHNPAGILVPARAPEAIAAALLNLSQPDTWERYAHAAHARFSASFTPGVVSGLWQDLIETVLEGAPEQ
jgi:glycosyltransferase involved in cell wall biosynthesis